MQWELLIHQVIKLQLTSDRATGHKNRKKEILLNYQPLYAREMVYL